MARYRKVDVRVWGDAWFRGLSPIPPCGQGLWFYLLTSQESGIIPGLSRVGEAAMAESLGWPLEAFREAFREVSRDGKARADWKARVVWVPNAVRFNKPESPNVVRSWAAAWDELPECDLKVEAWRALGAFCEGLGEGFAKAFREACPKPSANQEQEQEHDQLLGAAAPKIAPAAAAPKPASTVGRGETPAVVQVTPAGAPGDAKGTSHRKPEIGAGTPRPPGGGKHAGSPGEQAGNLPDEDLARPPVLVETPDAAGAPPPRWPLLVQFRHGVAEALARPDRSFAFPKDDQDADELEAHIARVGLDAAIARCVERAKDRAGQGRIGALSYFLHVLRDVPSRAPAPAAALAPAGCPEWEEAREQLRATARPDFFARWIAPLTARRDGDRLVILAPSAGAAAFLCDHHLPTLRAVVPLHIARVTVEAAAAAA